MPRRIVTHKPHASVIVGPLYRRTERRMEDNRFYASAAWRKLRAAFLAENPLCNECRAADNITAATEVHHVKERREYPELALDYYNLQALCHACHLGKRKKQGG